MRVSEYQLRQPSKLNCAVHSWSLRSPHLAQKWSIYVPSIWFSCGGLGLGSVAVWTLRIHGPPAPGLTEERWRKWTGRHRTGVEVGPANRHPPTMPCGVCADGHGRPVEGCCMGNTRGETKMANTMRVECANCGSRYEMTGCGETQRDKDSITFVNHSRVRLRIGA